jgi:GDP-4-dehydro-6-deoxy-D-mannose reductase
MASNSRVKAAVLGASGYSGIEAVRILAAHPFVATYKMHVVIVRPFNHTGPRQRADFVCSTFALQVVGSS